MHPFYQSANVSCISIADSKCVLYAHIPSARVFCTPIADSRCVVHTHRQPASVSCTQTAVPKRNPRNQVHPFHQSAIRIHFVIVMTWWMGLAPWEFEFPFPGSLISVYLPTSGTPILPIGTADGYVALQQRPAGSECDLRPDCWQRVCPVHPHCVSKTRLLTASVSCTPIDSQHACSAPRVLTPN